jgi:hypothetical protein
MNQIAFSAASGIVAVILLFLLNSFVPGIVLIGSIFLIASFGCKPIEKTGHAAIFWICLFTPWLLIQRITQPSQKPISMLIVILIIFLPAIALEAGFLILKRKLWSYFAVGAMAFLATTLPLYLNPQIKDSAPPIWAAPLMALVVGGGTFLLGAFLFEKFARKPLVEKWSFLGD